MSDIYYGVAPSSDFFAHYGVKGMKWGVRRAIERGSQAALTRQYAKAQKKLERLNKRADVDYQKSVAKKASKVGRIGLGVAGASGALGAAGNFVRYKSLKNMDNDLTNLHNRLASEAYRLPKGHRWTDQQVIQFREAVPWLDDKISETINKHQGRYWTAQNAQKAAAGIGAAGLATAAGAGAKYLVAKYRTSASGHKKAVAKRDEFRREMDQAFSGTMYRRKRKAVNSKKRRR